MTDDKSALNKNKLARPPAIAMPLHPRTIVENNECVQNMHRRYVGNW